MSFATTITLLMLIAFVFGIVTGAAPKWVRARRAARRADLLWEIGAAIDGTRTDEAAKTSRAMVQLTIRDAIDTCMRTSTITQLIVDDIVQNGPIAQALRRGDA